MQYYKYDSEGKKVNIICLPSGNKWLVSQSKVYYIDSPWFIKLSMRLFGRGFNINR